MHCQKLCCRVIKIPCKALEPCAVCGALLASNTFMCSDMPALCMQENGKPRFTPADLQSHLSPMFENLFLAFQKPESGENEYLMKCVMRVITFVGQEVGKT